MQGTRTRHKGDTKMKKLALILSLLLFFSSAVLADENTHEQNVKNDQAYFTANIQTLLNAQKNNLKNIMLHLI